MTKTFLKADETLQEAKKYINKSIRDVLIQNNIDIAPIEARLTKYKNNRKGYFGDLVEKYIFDIDNNNHAQADFVDAGVELKTTPLKKHSTKKYVSKERLVFSMINYITIIDEAWESSSFLKKNKTVLLIFYLWIKEQSILDYQFKFVHLLNLLNDISDSDILQIQQDWEFIVAKINSGNAHLLSESDTFILSACTKAANAKVRREQPNSEVSAKPRAFSFKQKYLNFLIQKHLLGSKTEFESLITTQSQPKTVEQILTEKLSPFINKSDVEIKQIVSWYITKTPKNWKRLLTNKMLGATSNKIEELEKSDITLKTITLEHTGTLKESISFPAFDYINLISQLWYDDTTGKMCEFHQQLELKKFLFVIFQKQKNSPDIIFKKFQFWNSPMEDLADVETVWQTTVTCIKNNDYTNLPKISQSNVAHVRPHGRNSQDTLLTPQGTQEPKKSFWLNAKYIQKAINN